MRDHNKNGPDIPAKTAPIASRRGFLGAGFMSASAAVLGAGAVVTPVQAAENAREQTKSRYRETEHVKKYYATNR